MKKLTPEQIDQLERDAKKLREVTGLSQAVALNLVASQHGHESWNALIRWNEALSEVLSVTGAPPPPEKPYVETLRRACARHVQSLGELGIMRLCSNGSIWVSKSDIRTKRRRGIRLESLGSTFDGVTQEVARDCALICLLDFDCLAERYVQDDDEDADGNPAKPGPNQVMYSEHRGRYDLLAIIRSDEFDDSVDQMLIELEAADQHEAWYRDFKEYQRPVGR